MTLLEDRLTAALDARAHQIGEADLSPAVLPEAAPRRRGLIILAAAACTALVIGVPYAIAQLDTTPEPPRSPTTAPPTTPGVGEGADWPVSGTGDVDLDGDGLDEVVRLRMNPEPVLNPQGNVVARVEVALPTGTVYVLLNDGSEYHLEGAVDLPGSPGEEQLVSVGTSLRVLDLVGGQLRVLDAPTDPPLMRRTDSQGRAVTWRSGKDGLISIRSVTTVLASETSYPVEQWRWKEHDSTLVAVELDGGCVSADEPSVVSSCVPGLPAQFSWDDQPERTGIGDELTLGFPVGGSPATAILKQNYAGDTRLTVSAGDNSWTTDASMGMAGPGFVGDGITVDADGQRAVLLSRTYAGDVVLEDFAVYGWFEGNLVHLVPDSGGLLPSTTSAVEGGTGLQHTWVQDGWLYTAVVPAGGGWNVYRWQQSGSSLVAELVADNYCFGGVHGLGVPC